MASVKTALIVIAVVAVGGGFAAKRFYIDRPFGAVVAATAETAPVRGKDEGADDVAIFVHPTDPAKSMIVAADKESGLLVYDAAGKELDFVELADANNVDLRTNVKLLGREITLVAAGEKRLHQYVLYELAQEAPYLRELPGGRVTTDLQAEGIALHRDPATGIASLFAIGKKRSASTEAKIQARALKAELADKPEGAAGAEKPAKAPKTSKKKAGKKADPKPAEVADAAAEVDAAGNAGGAPPGSGEKVATAAESIDPANGGGAELQQDDAGNPPLAGDAVLKPGKKERKGGFFAVQYELASGADGRIQTRPVRRIRLEGHVEGAVCDDEANALYLCEEEAGIYAYHATVPADAIEVGQLVCKVGFPHPLRADVEGIGIYAEPGGKGYLVVASQGSRDFVVLRREAPHEYVGRFTVKGQGDVDGVEGTDGLDVTSGSLGGPFASGVLILQDEKNVSADGAEVYQNFKLVAWSAVKEALGL